METNNQCEIKINNEIVMSKPQTFSLSVTYRLTSFQSNNIFEKEEIIKVLKQELTKVRILF